MENRTKIKKLNKKDTNKVYLLSKKEFGKEYWYKKDFIIKTMNTPNLKYGLFDKEELAGAIIVDLPDRPKAWIYLLIIDEEYRRKGFGNLLLKKIEKNLPKGYFLIFVDIGEKDITAKNFYKKNGFKKEAIFKDWFGNKEKGLIYVKRLSKYKIK